MHANVYNADKIKEQTDKNNYAELHIYKKLSEKLIAKKFKVGDIAIILQTAPKLYSGAIALVKICKESIVTSQECIIYCEFVRFFKRVISLQEIKALDKKFIHNGQQLLELNFDVFTKILELEVM